MNKFAVLVLCGLSLSCGAKDESPTDETQLSKAAPVVQREKPPGDETKGEPASALITGANCWPGSDDVASRIPASVDTLPEHLRPVVFSFDGMNMQLLWEGDPQKWGFKGRDRGYVTAAMNDYWLDSVAPNIRFMNMNSYAEAIPTDVQNIKLKNRDLFDSPRWSGRPVVVVAHGLGAVVAVNVIVELGKEGKLERGEIDQLVTFGAPIRSVNGDMQKKFNPIVKYQRLSDIKPFVKKWRNYWIATDPYSSDLQELGVDNVRFCSREQGVYEAHGDYFANNSNNAIATEDELAFWQKIGGDIVSDIFTHADPAALMLSSKEENKEYFQNYCLSDVCLGDRIEDLRDIEWEQFRSRFSPEAVIGPDLAELEILKEYQNVAFYKSDQESPLKPSELKLQTLFSALEKVEVVCEDRLQMAGSVERRNSNESVAVTFGVISNPKMETQTFEVLGITLTNSLVLANQATDWANAAIAKFPSAEKRGNNLLCVHYNKPCAIYDSTQRGSVIELRAAALETTFNPGGNPLADHSACPKTSFTIE